MFKLTPIIVFVLYSWLYLRFSVWQTNRALEMLLGVERWLLPAAAYAAEPEIAIEGRPFGPRSSEAETLFERLEASQIGIDKPLEFSMK